MIKLTDLQKQRKQKDIKLAIMINVIVLVFIVCNSFESLLFILQSLKLLNSEVVQDFLRPLADFLMVINSGVNVIIYCGFNPTFWGKFVTMFCCWCQVKSEDSKTLISMTQKPNRSTQMTISTSQQIQQETTL